MNPLRLAALIFLGVIASAIVISGPVEASCQHYARPLAFAPTYHAPTYHQAYQATNYVTNHHQAYETVVVKEYKDIVLVPLVQKIVVSPDYYFSVRDYYRDAIQLETLQLLRESRNSYRASSSVASSGASSSTGAPPGGAASTLSSPPAGGKGNAGPIGDLLKNVLASSCISCHGGPLGKKADLDFSKPEAVTSAQWMASYKSVKSGKMPKAASPLSDAETGLFLDRVEEYLR